MKWLKPGTYTQHTHQQPPGPSVVPSLFGLSPLRLRSPVSVSVTVTITVSNSRLLSSPWCNRWRPSPGLSKFRCKTMEISARLAGWQAGGWQAQAEAQQAQLAKKLYSRQLCKVENAHMRYYMLCVAHISQIYIYIGIYIPSLWCIKCVCGGICVCIKLGQKLLLGSWGSLANIKWEKFSLFAYLLPSRVLTSYRIREIYSIEF